METVIGILGGSGLTVLGYGLYNHWTQSIVLGATMFGLTCFLIWIEGLD